MRIHCDRCGVEIDRESAIVWESDGEILYFCSDRCFEEKDYHETMGDPGRGDEAAPPDAR